MTLTLDQLHALIDLAGKATPEESCQCPRCGGTGDAGNGMVCISLDGISHSTPATECSLCKGRRIVTVIATPAALDPATVADLARELLASRERVATLEAGGQTSQYVYSFSVWPDETWGFGKAVYDLFRMLNGRIEMTFTPDEFERFRSEISHHGLTAREVERVPYHEPEAVP